MSSFMVCVFHLIVAAAVVDIIIIIIIEAIISGKTR
jgi:hypothetical protein